MAGIRVELELIDGQFTSRMLHAGESVKQFNDNVARSDPALRQFAANGQLVFTSVKRVHDESRGFLSTMRDISIVTGVAGMAMSKVSQFINGWAGEIVRVNAEMERLTMLMRSMSKAADPTKDAADNVRYLRDMARETPFSLTALSEGFVRLKATGIDPMNGSMQALVDAVAGVGGSDVKLERVTLALSQMAGKGVIQMEELRQQLGEALPRATELMARSMGVSYAQLVKEVSTGRVMAVPAIEALRLELERVYGGSAIRQMQTFQGQLVRTKSLLMDLSTTEGNKKYFETVKLQLSDFNEFLSGNAAKVMANSMGEGLSSVVSAIRTAIDTLIDFRHEIISFGEMALYVIGGKLAVGAFGSFINGVDNARRSIATLRVEFAAMQTAIAMINTQNLVSSMPILGPTSAAPAAVTALTSTSTKLAAILPVVISSMAMLGTMLPVLGLAVWGVAEYFDVFGTKAERAWKELEKFGGVSRRQINDAAGMLNSLRKDRDDLIDIQSRVSKNQTQLPSYKARQDKINELNDLILKYEKVLADGEKDVNAQEGRAIATRLMAPIRDQMEQIQSAYDKNGIERSKYWDEVVAAAIKAGESDVNIQKAKQDEAKQNQLKFYDDQIALLDKFIADVTERSKSQTGAEQVGSLAAAKQATDESIRYQKARLDAERQLMGLQKTDKVIDREKNMERAKQLLENLRSKAAEYKAEIAGVEGEYAKLAYLLGTAKKFGDGKTDTELQAIIDKLLSAQEEVDTLHEKMKGMQALRRDIDNALMDAEKSYFQEIKRAAGKDGDVSKVEEIYLRLKNGLYKGVDSNSSVDGLKTSLNNAKVASDNLSNSLVNNVFGAKVTSAAGAFGGVLDQIIAKWREFRGLVDGTNVDGKLITPSAGQAANTVSEGVKSIMNTGVQLAKITAGGLSAMVNKDAASAFQGFLNDLTAAGYKIKVLEGYSNRTMTGNPNKMSEHAYGKAIDINPDENPYGKNLVTDMPVELIRQLVAKWGLTWGGDWKSVKDAMHVQWNGGKTNSQSATSDAASTELPTQNAILETIKKIVGAKEASKLIEAVTIEAATKKLRNQNDLNESIKKEKAAIAEANEEILTGGKHLAKVKEEIKQGKHGGESKNPEAEEYKELIKLARDRDAAEKKLTETRKNRRSEESGIEKAAQLQEEYAERMVVAQRRIADPNELKLGDKYYSLERELDKYVTAAEKLYGKDSENYRKMLEMKEQMLGKFKATELLELGAKTAKENVELRTKLGTESQQRLAAYQLQVRQIDAALAQIRADESMTADQRLAVEKALLEKKALLNQQYAANGPIAKQMIEWKDLGNNMQKAATGWLDSLADGIADFVVTGKLNFKSLAQSILKDMTKLMFKWAFSNMFGGKAGAVGGKGAGKGKAGASMILGAKHTGGIIGNGLGSSMRMINVRGFSNASRFHTGGMLNRANITRALGLSHNEVPIIALRNEGVFTEEQMKVIAESLAATGTLAKNGKVFTGDQHSALMKFAGARKFHTGGIIGGNIPSSVAPSAANEGFGSNNSGRDFGRPNSSFAVTNHIKVEGSAGSPEQNEDLANKIGKSVEASMRQVVIQELMTQTRPGGLLRQIGRTGK